MEARNNLKLKLRPKAKRPIITGSQKLRQVRLPALSVVFFTVFAAFLSLGCERPAVKVLRTIGVAGVSMAPSVWGPHITIQCPECRISWLANWQKSMLPRREIHCWNCGTRFDAPFAPSTTIISVTADHVLVDSEAYQQRDPERNDLVAVHDRDGWRIKRVVAMPGDALSVDDQQRLLVNDKAVTTDAPWVIVHDDRYRGSTGSWWQAAETNWQVTSSGFLAVADGQSPCNLVYRHRNVYDRQQPDLIRDDCPFNLTENRVFRPVHQLSLECQVDCKTPGKVEVWFLVDSIRYQVFDLAAGTSTLQASTMVATSYQSDPSKHPNSPVQLTVFQPIVIRLNQGTAELRDLVIRRPVEYWVDTQDQNTISFPQSLAQDEYFLMGDNVPLSIDSRHTGPVRRDWIRGKVMDVIPR